MWPSLQLCLGEFEDKSGVIYVKPQILAYRSLTGDYLYVIAGRPRLYYTTNLGHAPLTKLHCTL